jgi:hypothetical protein
VRRTPASSLDPRHPRRAALLLAAIFAAGTAISCGASIQAVYEGDVRFEHCMALDSRPDVQQPRRKACWEEWTQFYTFGQTRDRIDYASKREKQLEKTSDDDALAPTNAPAATVPEPTSALAPPPMMLITDGGGDGSADASADGSLDDAGDAGDAARPPGAECSAACEQTWNLCRKDCKTATCDKTCGARYTRCEKRCF